MTKKKSLLEKAVDAPRPHGNVVHHVTDESIEMALAWARGKLTIKQITFAIGLRPGKWGGSVVYSILARSLGEYVRRKG